MIAVLLADRRKLGAVAALSAVAAIAVLYGIWRAVDRPDYAVDTAQYLKGVPDAPRSFDATVPASAPLAPRPFMGEPASFGAQPRAALPTDQELPPRSTMSWSTPQPAFVLPEFKSPIDLNVLSGFDKIPELPSSTLATSIPMLAEPSPGTSTFRLIIPGAAPTGAIGSPTGLPSSIPGGAIGAATGLLKR